MTRILTLLFCCLITAAAWAQTVPQGIHYQAVLRSDYGIPMGDRELDVRVAITDPANGFTYYEEHHHVAVAPEGTFGLIIGQGHRLSGTFRMIPWSVGNLWADIQYDLDGNGQFVSSGGLQLLSVPYAFYAQTAGGVEDDIEQGAETRDDTVIEKYWKTNGNNLIPPDTAPFTPEEIIQNQDIIPQFLGIKTMKPLLIRTSDSLRLFIMPNGDLYVLKDQYNYGDLDVRGNGRFWGDLIVKGNLTADNGEFDDLHVLHNAYIDNDLWVKNNARVDGDLDVYGIGHFHNATQSTTNDNGAVIIEGGVGIEQNVNIGGDTKIDGITTINNTAQSTTKDNGALVVEGGVGVERNLNVGGNTSLAGDLDLGGKLTITDNTQSTATTNGALVVAGGVGIGKNVNIGGNLDVRNMGSTHLTGTLEVDKATDLNATLNVDGATTLNNTLEANGQVTIHTLVTGGQGSYAAYPLRVEGSQQGIAIKLNPQYPNETNNFITFFGSGTDNSVGRIEGQTGLSGIVRQVAIDIVGDVDFDDAIGGNTDKEQDPQENAAFGDYMGSNYAFEAINLTVDFVFTIFQFAVNAAAASGACLAGDCDDAIWSFIDMIKTGGQLAALIIVNELNIGVTYESGGADYAEWLMRYDSLESIHFGEVVGVRGGQISKTFETAESYMVVSDKPGVLGAMPAKGKDHLYEKVAFMGQVPVKVMGEVQIGDFILPSGNEDGMAIAIRPDQANVYDYKRIIGVAWSASLPNTMINYINVAVGLQQNQLADVVEQMQGVMNEMQLALARLSPDYKPFYFETERTSHGSQGPTEWTALPEEVQIKEKLAAKKYTSFQSQVEDMKTYAAAYGFNVQDYPLLGEFIENPTTENAQALADYYEKAMERGQKLLQTAKAYKKG
ncbi:MAG: hypothetical protein K9I85_15725 [Saprospiraceae bacterium]|nr:hypothetical protein [Saprospiraceae bacterium]